MSEKDVDEFKNAVRYIARLGTRLENPYDRVRVAEWVRKLAQVDNDDMENAKRKNEYIQLLRIQINHLILKSPFTQPPPDGILLPLPELLGNIMCSRIPGLPRSGPIAPAIVHQSPDGKAFLSIKQIPGNGVLCYMTVTPDTFPGQKPC